MEYNQSIVPQYRRIVYFNYNYLNLLKIKNMKKNNFLFYVFIGMLSLTMGLASCNNDELLEQVEQESVTTDQPTGLTLQIKNQAGVIVSEGTYKFINVETGEETLIKYGESTAPVADGVYNLVFEGLGKSYLSRGSEQEFALYGEAFDVLVEDGEINLILKAFANGVNAQDDFLIVEIFPSGTATPEGRQYNGGDQYIKIGNNTSHTLYADGLVLLESSFPNNLYMDCVPYILDTDLPVHTVLRIPGNGTTYPVEPGETIIICDNAKNHLDKNPNSFDLSNADFEWYIKPKIENTKFKDEPTPGKIYLEEIYTQTRTLWILNKQGNMSYAIARMPEGVDKESYKANYEYKYRMRFNNGELSRELSTYRFPNANIIDAVNLSPGGEGAWKVSVLDRSHAYVGESRKISEHYGKSVIRDSKIQNGRIVWIDSNDSSFDFLHSQTASMFN